MTGKACRVQAQIMAISFHATFVHCSYYRLNLTMHNLKALSGVHNIVNMIKAIFFHLLPNISMLCERQRMQRYKSIHLSAEKSHKSCLSAQAISKIKQHQNDTHTNCFVYHQQSFSIACRVIISKYYSKVKSVMHTLQLVYVS